MPDARETPRKTDICICGGGPTGFAAAIALARSGLNIAILAPPAKIPAARTAALLDGSIRFLQGIDAWVPEDLDGAALRAMRLIDDTGSLIRAPEVTFHASEMGLKAFGHNVPNSRLVASLRAIAAGVEKIGIIEERAADIKLDDETARVFTETGVELSTRLVIAADGAKSLARTIAGIDVQNWSYPQSALITTLSVEYPHGGVSTEFHTRSGPFTLVPLAPNRMSLVWMQAGDRARQAMEMSTDEFDRLVERQAQSIHGRMQVDGERAVLPLRGLLAKQFAANRIVLVGEAAHVFPPIGAQGLNLGLRDVAKLADILPRHKKDPGCEAALRAYQAGRQLDVRSRTYAVDLFNRSLLSSFVPAHLLRSGGLSLASTMPAFRQFLMRRGLSDVSTPV